MKKNFKILGAIGITALLGVSFTLAYTQEEYNAYQWAYQYKITTQPTIEKANLNGKLTRQELAKMLTNYLENVARVNQTTSSCTFTDEDQINNNLKPYTKKICAYQIMGNNGKNFKPTNKVTRAELGTTISRMLWGDKHNVEGKGYYIYHLNALKDQGIMNNIKNPTESFAKRGDTFIMLKRIYDKFGSNIYLNGGSTTEYNNGDTTSDSNDIIANLYANSNVVYETKDGHKYYYDADFLKILKNLASNKGESDLKKYLAIESEYYKEGLSQLSDLDEDKIMEMLGIDLSDVDIDNLNDKEKAEIINKIKKGMDSLLKENEKRNETYLNNLEKVTKNIKDDEFGLKDKYKKTKTFVEKTNKFLASYIETLSNLLDLAVNEDELDEEEGMALAFGLVGDVMTYNVVASEYQEYVENWAKDTLKLLGEKTTNSNKDKNENTQGNKTDSSEEDNTSNIITEPKNEIQTIVEDMLATAPFRGNKNARFTIVEYTELHCPYCAGQSTDGTINTVIKQLPGEVNSVSRHFIIHGDTAQNLAAAMECVAELKPTVYYKTLEKAFEAFPVDMEGLTNIATSLGVNKSSLQTCINKGKHKKDVKNMMNLGKDTFGIYGTPGNVIIDRETGNYEVLMGGYPADVFVEVINEMKKA